jgi:hypothetical protein
VKFKLTNFIDYGENGPNGERVKFYLLGGHLHACFHQVCSYVCVTRNSRSAIVLHLKASDGISFFSKLVKVEPAFMHMFW